MLTMLYGRAFPAWSGPKDYEHAAVSIIIIVDDDGRADAPVRR